MTLTFHRPWPAFLTFVVILTSAPPAYAQRGACPWAGPTDTGTQRRIALYSPRVRRSTVSYLRLRLLELREEGLDRARAAIERRLSIDELVMPPSPSPSPSPAARGGRNAAQTAPPTVEKAKCPARRNDEP